VNDSDLKTNACCLFIQYMNIIRTYILYNIHIYIYYYMYIVIYTYYHYYNTRNKSKSVVQKYYTKLVEKVPCYNTAKLFDFLRS
jgi:hypothetical protein